MCSLKICLTTETTYSVSDSVNSTTGDDFSTLPYGLNSGILRSSCWYFWAAADAEAATSVLDAATFVGPALGALMVGVTVVSFFVRSSASACSLVTTGMEAISKGRLKTVLSSAVTYRTS
jgi:hypothetical protein